MKQPCGSGPIPKYAKPWTDYERGCGKQRSMSTLTEICRPEGQLRSGMECDYRNKRTKRLYSLSPRNIIVPLRKVNGILGESFCRHWATSSGRETGSRATGCKGKVVDDARVGGGKAMFRGPAAH